MSRILFACFHRSDRATLLPLLEQMRDVGHDTAVLLPLANPPADSDLQGQQRFTPDELAAEETIVPRDLMNRLLPETLNRRQRTLLADHLPQLAPNLSDVFPYQVKSWSRVYSRFVDATIGLFRPDVVVLALGKLETPIVRARCAAAGIACGCLLPLYLEFKSQEPACISGESEAEEIYCVSGDYGKRRLMQTGIAAAQIAVTGNPAFDSLRAIGNAGNSIDVTGNPNRDPTILYAMQSVPDNRRLFLRLQDYLNSFDDVQLIARFHPATPARER
jgi:hypothetical protein